MPAAMHVRLANGEKSNSLGQVSGLVLCVVNGMLGMSFMVLDLAFDVVLGLSVACHYQPLS